MQIKKFLSNLLIPKVYAHCDIPCGMYDPTAARMAAATVLKMVQKINELPAEGRSVEEDNNFVRMVMNKEEHSQRCKTELLILWTDYFKPEHLEKFPDLHETFWNATKLCSYNKQHVDEEKARELIKAVDEIAEIFQDSKKPS